MACAMPLTRGRVRIERGGGRSKRWGEGGIAPFRGWAEPTSISPGGTPLVGVPPGLPDAALYHFPGAGSPSLPLCSPFPTQTLTSLLFSLDCRLRQLGRGCSCNQRKHPQAEVPPVGIDEKTLKRSTLYFLRRRAARPARARRESVAVVGSGMAGVSGCVGMS